MPRSQGRRRHYSRTWSWFGSTYPERWNGLAIELAEWTRLSSLESCEFGGRVEVKGPFVRMGRDEGGSAEREQPTLVRSWLLGLPGRIQRKEVLYVDTFTTVSVRHTGAVALLLL